MSLELLFNFIALRLNQQKVDGLNLGINLQFTDLRENWALELSNSVLNNTTRRILKAPDATLTLTRPVFLSMLLQGNKLPDLVQAGTVKLEGGGKALAAVFANVETFDPFFNIVTP